MDRYKWVAGIDYSMTCPAIAIADLDVPFSFVNCQIRYFSDKVPNNKLPNIHSSRMQDCETNEERFDKIALWTMECIRNWCGDAPVSVYLEDYSYASKGKVFHIAENTGLLKHHLYKAGISYVAVPPTVIKKLARGKGKGNKDEMYEAFVKETAFELMPIFQPKAEFVGSPVGDIVDSFYICKYGYLNIKKG